MHNSRLKRTGTTDPSKIAVMRTLPLSDRVQGRYRVDEDSGCWVWTDAVNDRGYGQLGYRGKIVYAHRVSYEAAKGPIPAAMDLDHLCRVPRCINPDHLEAVNHAENIRRGVSPVAENARKTHCVHGHLLSGDNIRWRKHGWRNCKTCDRQRSKERRR